MNEEPRRILIIRTRAIGDVLLCTPVAGALREAHPSAWLAWLVEESAREVVQGNPFLDEVIVWPQLSWRGQIGNTGRLRYLARQRNFIRELGQRRFDTCLDLQGKVSTALLAWLARIPRRVGFADASPPAALFYNKKAIVARTSAYLPKRCLDICNLLGWPCGDADTLFPLDDEETLLARNLLRGEVIQLHPHNADQPYAIFCPAAARPHKFWHPDGFATVADWASRDLGMLPVFLGSQREVPLVEKVTRLCSVPFLSLAGKTNLRQAAALIQGAALVVGLDTASAHLATSLGKPSVTIFGPAGIHYQPRGPLHETLRADCHLHPCRWTRKSCPAGYECVLAVRPEQVMAAVRRVLLAAERRGGR